MEDLNTLSLNENEITITDYINSIMNSNDDDEEDEIVEYPEPTPLRISTLTGTCSITSDINLLVLAQYLELNKYITYINYGDIVTKGVNITPKSNKKKKMVWDKMTKTVFTTLMI